MPGRKNHPTRSGRSDRADASVPPQTGSPPQESELRIDSPVEGSIQHPGSVHVAAQGLFRGPIHARTITVDGEVVGDLHAQDAIRIGVTARVRGALSAPRIAVAPGARLRGRLTMPRSEPPVATLDAVAVHALLTGKDA